MINNFKNWLKHGLLLTFFLLSNTVLAQIKGLDSFIPKKNASEIDIKIINNTILLPIDLDYNLRFYFILDTGVSTTIITEPLVQNILQLPVERTIKLKGYGRSRPIEALVCKAFNYNINKAYFFEDQYVIVIDESLNLDKHFGLPVYGIIGYDFLKNYQVVIDFNRSKLILRNPLSKKRIRRLRKKKNVIVYNLDFNDGTKPIIKAKLNQKSFEDSVELILDTGFSGALTLYPNNQTDNLLQKPFIPHYQGIGMNGEILSSMKKLESLTLSKNVRLKNITTNFMDSLSVNNLKLAQKYDGSIGNDVLRRFYVTLDYPNNVIILKPNRRILSNDFHYNLSGIRLIMEENETGWHYIISTLRRGSAALESGLQRQDILLKINGQSIKGKSLKDIYRLLNDFGQNQRQVTVLRNQEEIEFTFSVKPLEAWN